MKLMKRLYEQIRRKREDAGFVGVRSNQVRRSIQLDGYSCGAHAVKSVLLHVGVSAPRMQQLKYMLNTTKGAGTSDDAILTYLRTRGLRAGAESRLSIRKLRALLARGHIVLCDVDGDHIALVHGMDGTAVHIADPSAVRCPGRRQPLSDFRKRFGRSGIVVRVR